MGQQHKLQRAPQSVEPEVAHHDPAVAVATKLARWLDGRFVDPLLGLLLPGVGDLISGALGVYPILLAWRARVPKVLLARMFLNLSIDAVGGAVPVLGDIWDFLFRAHAKNLALLQSRSRDGALKSRPIGRAGADRRGAGLPGGAGGAGDRRGAPRARAARLKLSIRPAFLTYGRISATLGA